MSLLSGQGLALRAQRHGVPLYPIELEFSAFTLAQYGESGLPSRSRMFAA
jgi:hypothetical protein